MPSPPPPIPPLLWPSLDRSFCLSFSFSCSLPPPLLLLPLPPSSPVSPIAAESVLGGRSVSRRLYKSKPGSYPLRVHLTPPPPPLSLSLSLSALLFLAFKLQPTATLPPRPLLEIPPPPPSPPLSCHHPMSSSHPSPLPTPPTRSPRVFTIRTNIKRKRRNNHFFILLLSSKKDITLAKSGGKIRKKKCKGFVLFPRPRCKSRGRECVCVWRQNLWNTQEVYFWSRSACRFGWFLQEDSSGWMDCVDGREEGGNGCVCSWGCVVGASFSPTKGVNHVEAP